MNWEKGDPTPATPPQIGMLKRAGIPTDDITKRSAGQFISEIMKRQKKGLCNYRQSAILQKHGYDKDMPRENAVRVLKKIANTRPVSRY